MRPLIGALIAILLPLAFLPLAALAQSNELVFPSLQPGTGRDRLVVYSTIDIDAAKPIMLAFQATFPSVEVTYHDLNSIDLYVRVLEESDDLNRTADILLSSAMDLQIKLANDGYAYRHQPANLGELPDWANWRNEAFGFTFEPAVIVYNRNLIAEDEVPRTRFDLARLITGDQNRFFDSVATYDLERSGFGYLLATQDSRISDVIWDLAAAMGSSGVKLYSNTSAMLDHIQSGRFAIGYNLLGSYAITRAQQSPELGIVLPEDYTLVSSRIAVIPRAAENIVWAQRFIDFILSLEGQTVLANEAGLFSIHPAVRGTATEQHLRAQAPHSIVPIVVGPGLMVDLDQARRASFLRRWEDALVGGQGDEGSNQRTTTTER